MSEYDNEEDDISALEDDRNEAKFQENNIIAGVGAGIDFVREQAVDPRFQENGQQGPHVAVAVGVP